MQVESKTTPLGQVVVTTPGPSRTSRRQAEARAAVQQNAAFSPPLAIGGTTDTPASPNKPTIARRTLPPRKRISTRGSSPTTTSSRVPLTPVVTGAANGRSTRSSPVVDHGDVCQQTVVATADIARKDVLLNESGAPSPRSACFKTAASSPATPSGEPAHTLRSVRSVDAMNTIPFPPEIVDDQMDVEVEGQDAIVLDADDLRDERLMATFAALDVGGNRAMSVQEIGDVSVGQGWIRQSPALSPAAVIQNAIRTYLRRCQVASPPRQPIIAKRQLAGSMIELHLAPALHPQAISDGKPRPKGTVWYLQGRYAGKEWSSPFDPVQAEIDRMVATQQEEKSEGGRKRVDKRRSGGARAAGTTKGKGKQEEEGGTAGAGAGAKRSSKPRKQARSREGTTVSMADVPKDSSSLSVVMPVPIKIRLKVTRPEPSAPRTGAEDDRDPIDCFRSDGEDVKPVIDGREDDMDVDQDASESPSRPSSGPQTRRNSTAQDDSDSNWSMSDSEEEEDQDDQIDDGNVIVKREEAAPLIAPPSTPPSAQDSHLFPCNPLDPVNLSEPRQSHYILDDSSSDEEEDGHMRSSLFGRFRAVGLEDSRHGHHDIAFDDHSDVDTPATTPRHCPEWDKEEQPPIVPQTDPAKEERELQHAVQVLGSLLPDFGQARLSSSPVDVKPIIPLCSDQPSASPPPPPTTPIKERRPSAGGDLDSREEVNRRNSAGGRNVFNLHIPLPRMTTSSPLASPSAHAPVRGKQHMSLEAKIAAYNRSPTRGDASLPDDEFDEEDLLPPLEGMHTSMELEDDELICKVEEEEMIWETEGMTLGDSPASDDPETMVGSPTDSCFVLIDPILASDQGSAIDIVNWSRSNEIAEDVEDASDYRWKASSPVKISPCDGDVSADRSRRGSSPLTSLGSECVVSPGSACDLSEAIARSPLAPLAQLDALTEQDWTNLLGPESVGIDELDTVWGLFSDALEGEADCSRPRRGNSEETIPGNKRSDKACKSSGRRGRSNTIGEWGHIGVGHVSQTCEVRKEKARFARVLLAKAAVAASGRSQSRESRRTTKGKGPASESTETDDGVGIRDLEEAARDLAVGFDQQPSAESPSAIAVPTESEDNQEDLLAFASLQYSDDYYPSLGITPWLLSARSDLTPVSVESGTPVIAPSPSSQVAASTPAGSVSTPIPLAPVPQPAHKAVPVPIAPAAASKSTVSLPSAPASAPPAPPRTMPPKPPAVTGTASAPPSSAPTPSRLSGTVTPAAGPVPVPRVLVVYPQKQIYPNCRAQVVDRIPVFHCIWNNTTLLRRIDSDYINVSALLKAIDAPRRVEIAESLAAQPSNVRVTSSQDIGTAGVWVPLHIGREVARSCSAPKPLLDIFLHDNLPDYFPSPLPNVKAAFKIGSNGRSSNCFGLPFGSILTGKTYATASGGAATARPGGIPPKGVARPTIQPAPSVTPAPSAQVGINKRPSPPVSASDANKPAKRRKSVVDTEPVVAITPKTSAAKKASSSAATVITTSKA